MKRLLFIMCLASSPFLYHSASYSSEMGKEAGRIAAEHFKEAILGLAKELGIATDNLKEIGKEATLNLQKAQVNIVIEPATRQFIWNITNKLIGKEVRKLCGGSLVLAAGLLMTYKEALNAPWDTTGITKKAISALLTLSGFWFMFFSE